jgi:hypothetical protein
LSIPQANLGRMGTVTNIEMDRRISELAERNGAGHDSTVRVTHVDPASLRERPLAEVIAEVSGEDTNGGSPPRNTHPKARERDEEIIGLLTDGPKTTTQIGAALGIEDGARQILARLAQRGKIKSDGRISEQGGAVLWSLVEGPAKPPVGMPPPSEDAVLAVLGRMFSSTREVGEAVGATTQAVRRVLETLAEKDRVVRQDGPPLKWRLFDPTELAEPQAEPAPEVVRAPARPLVDDPLGGGVMSYDEVFDQAMQGIADLVSDEWMANHAQAAVLRWARNGQPLYFDGEPAADAYLKLLLTAAERVGPGAQQDAICDRIERVIWGHTLGG